MKKLKLFSRLALFLNLILVCCLLLSYAAPYISPAQFWPIAFFGLALPYLLIINSVFLVYWALKGSKYFFLTLMLFALGYKSIPTLIQFDFNAFSKVSFNKEEGLKVLSFNVRIFDLYMWSKDRGTRNKILEFLEEEDPDILCLQEFYYQKVPDSVYEFKTLDTLEELLSAKYYHVENTIQLNNDHFGIITFSKHPIVDKGIVSIGAESDNICIYTDILLNEDTLRVYNGHLSSIKLDKHDYKAIRGLNKIEYSESFGKEKMILRKLKQSFQQRAIQADSVGLHIKNSPHPVIFCGDFNDTPSSYAYRQIRGELEDAFMDSGSGLGQTYIGDFPSFRIDYIFYDSQFSSLNYTTHPEELSDHHPISATLNFKKE